MWVPVSVCSCMSMQRYVITKLQRIIFHTWGILSIRCYPHLFKSMDDVISITPAMYASIEDNEDIFSTLWCRKKWQYSLWNQDSLCYLSPKPITSSSHFHLQPQAELEKQKKRNKDIENANTATQNINMYQFVIGGRKQWKMKELHSPMCPPQWKAFRTNLISLNSISQSHFFQFLLPPVSSLAIRNTTILCASHTHTLVTSYLFLL